jgi:hypothetical protein
MMRVLWIVSAVLTATALAGGIYYFHSRVEVVTPPPPAEAPKGPRPDTFGDWRTSKPMQFPGQASDRQNDASKK